MGLLSKLTGAVTPPKKGSDEALLLHGLLLISGADGVFEDSEKAGIESFWESIPQFRDKDFNATYQEAYKVATSFGNLKESVKALSNLSSRGLKDKCYMLAADLAMSSGDVAEDEDQMLEAMQRVLEVPDSTAQKIIEVLSIKYTS